MKYLVAFVFSLFMMCPTVAYDPILEFYRLKEHYKWITPEIYYMMYSATRFYSNISEDDICAIIQSESGDYCRNNLRCMINVISYAGAVGVMQVMPGYGRGNREQLKNPYRNIIEGAKYFSWCLQYAKGNKREALRFYNAGPFSIAKNYTGWRYVNAIITNEKTTKEIFNEYRVIK